MSKSCSKLISRVLRSTLTDPRSTRQPNPSAAAHGSEPCGGRRGGEGKGEGGQQGIQLLPAPKGSPGRENVARLLGPPGSSRRVKRVKPSGSRQQVARTVQQGRYGLGQPSAPLSCRLTRPATHCFLDTLLEAIARLAERGARVMRKERAQRAIPQLWTITLCSSGMLLSNQLDERTGMAARAATQDGFLRTHSLLCNRRGREAERCEPINNARSMT